MTDRAQVEAFLRHAYAVRQRENLDEIVELFEPGGSLDVLGVEESPPAADHCRPAMSGILDTFQLLDHSIKSIIIDGDMAAVYWHGRFRAKATNKVGETDLVDVFEMKNGRIAWMKTFFDTAMAARLTGQ